MSKSFFFKCLLKGLLNSFLITALLFLIAACSDGVSPQIEELNFDGQAKDLPTMLLFSLSFSDPTGDLGEGKLETFIGNSDSGLPALPLSPLFLQNDVQINATQGFLLFEVELNLGLDQSEWPQRGQSFQFGARLQDAAGNVSELVNRTLIFTEVPE